MMFTTLGSERHYLGAQYLVVKLFCSGVHYKPKFSLQKFVVTDGNSNNYFNNLEHL